ncbi:MAG: hypothetical protein ACYC2T_13910 [Bacillota bacterium]
MNKREIASLACKLLGIYMIIQGVNVMLNVFSLLIMSPQQATYNIFNTTIFPFLFLIVFGVILLFQSKKLANIMVREDQAVLEKAELKACDIQRISFSVIGLYFLGVSIPQVVSSLVAGLFMRGTPYEVTANLSFFYQSAGVITQFILGLGIFLGSQGLVNLLNAIRNDGPKQNNIHDE